MRHLFSLRSSELRLLHQWLFMSSECSPHSRSPPPLSHSVNPQCSPLPAVPLPATKLLIGTWFGRWTLSSLRSRAFNPTPRSDIRGRIHWLTFLRLTTFMSFYIFQKDIASRPMSSRRLDLAFCSRRVLADFSLHVVMSRDKWTCDQIIRTLPPSYSSVAAFRFFRIQMVNEASLVCLSLSVAATCSWIVVGK